MCMGSYANELNFALELSQWLVMPLLLNADCISHDQKQPFSIFSNPNTRHVEDKLSPELTASTPEIKYEKYLSETIFCALIWVRDIQCEKHFLFLISLKDWCLSTYKHWKAVLFSKHMANL